MEISHIIQSIILDRQLNPFTYYQVQRIYLLQFLNYQIKTDSHFITLGLTLL